MSQSVLSVPALWHCGQGWISGPSAVKQEVMRPGVRAVVETESRKEQMNVTVDTKLKLPALNSLPACDFQNSSDLLFGPELPFLPVSCDVQEAHLCTQVNNLPYKGYYTLEALFKTVSRQ